MNTTTIQTILQEVAEQAASYNPKATAARIRAALPPTWEEIRDVLPGILKTFAANQAAALAVAVTRAADKSAARQMQVASAGKTQVARRSLERAARTYEELAGWVLRSSKSGEVTFTPPVIKEEKDGNGKRYAALATAWPTMPVKELDNLFDRLLLEEECFHAHGEALLDHATWQAGAAARASRLLEIEELDGRFVAAAKAHKVKITAAASMAKPFVDPELFSDWEGYHARKANA